jgi:hypothetical protein
MLALRVSDEKVIVGYGLLERVAEKRNESLVRKESLIFVCDKMPVNNIVSVEELVAPGTHGIFAEKSPGIGLRSIEAGPIAVVRHYSIAEARQQGFS